MAIPSSPFGYCAVHNKVATDSDIYQQGLNGKLPTTLNQFAKDIAIGVYPRKVW